MKKFLLILILSGSIFANDGEQLYNTHCGSCHTTGAQKIAPPIFAVINHIKKQHTTKEDFINSVVEWVQNPNKTNAVMPGAIKKFGLMPKLNIHNADLVKIAEFLYTKKHHLPKWYQQHYKKEHGTMPKH
jgi:cytochrome c551/c552